jgi:prepilin-type processing-associated H-X9-DG protein
VGQPSILRTRSYSMSGCWGGRTNEVQTAVSRMADAPNPAKLFVFIDEDEDSIDDAHFLTWPEPDTRWVNLPAGRHGNVGILSFADGRVEMAQAIQEEAELLEGSGKRSGLGGPPPFATGHPAGP